MWWHQAWLAVDPDHVAFVYCDNGRTRTAIVMACVLRYLEKVRGRAWMRTWHPSTGPHLSPSHGTYLSVCLVQVGSASQGFQLFCRKRCQQELSPPQVASQVPPSLHQFFRNFDTVVEACKLPNPEALVLERVRLQGVPVDDLPVIDVLDCQHGKVRS